MDHTCQIYLVIAPGGSAEEQLADALGTVPAAAVLVRPETHDRFGSEADTGLVRALVTLAQAHDAAAILAADPDMVVRTQADGLHLAPSANLADQFKAARAALGADRIVGAVCGKSRHDAMTLGEAGADYVGFGVPAHVKDLDGAKARRFDLIRWWSEIFETPCVAFDVDADADARALAAAGADFIGFTVPTGVVGNALESRLQSLVAAMDEGSAAAGVTV